MKALLIAFAMLGGAQVFAAAKDCTPYIVTNGDGPGQYVYPCGTNYTVNHRGCNEGEVAYTSVFDGNAYEQVAIVCHNGTFYPPTKDVPHMGCKEGEIAYDNVWVRGYDYQQQITVVCHNGKFVPAHQ